MSASQSSNPTSKPLPATKPVAPPEAHASAIDELEIVEVGPAPAPTVTKSSPPPPPVRRPVEIVEETRPAPAARPTFASMLLLDAFRPADPLAIAKMTPAVTARRARLQNMVKVVVAGCAALCLVALVRSATAAPQESSDGAVAATASSASHLLRKAVAVKTLATDEEVRADALRATAWARRAGSRHR